MRCVLNATLGGDTICHKLAAGRWFSPGTEVTASAKTDRHDMTETLLKEELKHHNLF
jgi:hypothetical protein